MVIQVVMTKTIGAAEFKATCLEVLDRVAATGQGVIVTKRGRPVARVVPLVNKPDQIVGALKGTVEIRGDIVSPIRLAWKALKSS
jgi:prevent-host-death family protein